MGKNNAFNDTWASQTDIGKLVGMSSVAVGKELTAFGLRDGATKLATAKALEEGWCRSTPFKDGTPHFRWHIEKVSKMLEDSGHAKLSPAEFAANKAMERLIQGDKLIDEGSKLGYMIHDDAYDSIPAAVKDEVLAILQARGR